MGRAKLTMEFITKEKARNTTFQKRKKGLKKKAYELSTLCDVPICVIIYPYSSQSKPEIWPSNCEKVREIIDRYNSVPKKDQQKRVCTLGDILEGRKRKVQQDLFKLQKNSTATKYSNWHASFDSFDKDQLMKMLLILDERLETVRTRIASMKGSEDLTAPINSFPSDNLLGLELFQSQFEIGFINQFPRYYVNHGWQLVPFGANQLTTPMITMASNGMDLTCISDTHGDDGGSAVALCKYVVGPISSRSSAVMVDDGAVNGYATPIMWHHGGDDSLDMTMPQPILMSNLSHDNHAMNGCFDYINELKMFHK
ncbi:hypothetical protein Nepgr_024815 [Nepenthes gracilis]|uniref:MADS-box domain-containing protein n=1 Tax=Nepenthes gracilis TaxID=150966 RepID=A0AAD3T591_NEPGR|nr:hypothetical protein Nepgr_024815 [Nepenthes gracilis]